MKSYFKFSKGQKIGVVAIIVVILVQIVILNKGNAIGIPDPFVIDKSEYKINEGNSYYSEDKLDNDKVNNVNYSYVLYDFDPNSTSVDGWISFGFSEKQANTIVNYKTKISGFKKKEDLKKVYVISEEKYIELEPYIKIESNSSYKSKTYSDDKENNKTNLLLVELNSATVEDLVNIKGVGDYTAKGIIKYKELLGGFHSVNQLKEVYGISEENYEKIKPQVEINLAVITKLNVNHLSIPELKKHPYISWKVANAIIDKRLISKLTSIQFLVDDNYLTHEELHNLSPYIIYE